MAAICGAKGYDFGVKWRVVCRKILPVHSFGSKAKALKAGSVTLLNASVTF